MGQGHHFDTVLCACARCLSRHFGRKICIGRHIFCSSRDLVSFLSSENSSASSLCLLFRCRVLRDEFRRRLPNAISRQVQSIYPASFHKKASAHNADNFCHYSFRRSRSKRNFQDSGQRHVANWDFQEHLPR